MPWGARRLLAVAVLLLATACVSSSGPDPCQPSEFDLMFVLDSSSSLGEENWNVIKRFAAATVDGLNIVNSDIR